MEVDKEYKPPEEKDLIEYYDRGFNDSKEGKEYSEPYPNESPYGIMDEANFQYYRGFYS